MASKNQNVTIQYVRSQREIAEQHITAILRLLRQNTGCNVTAVHINGAVPETSDDSEVWVEITL